MTELHEVPKLLLAHQDYLRGADYREYAGTFILQARETAGEEIDWRTRANSRQALGQTFCNVQQGVMAAVPSIHASNEVLSRAWTLAASELPDDVPWTPAHFPAPMGTIMFESNMMFADTDGPTSVGMIIWNWEQVDDTEAVSLAVYTDATDTNDTAVQMREAAAQKAHLAKGEPDMPHVPLGRWLLCQFGAIWRDQLTGPAPVDIPVSELAPMSSLPRFIYGLLSEVKSRAETASYYTDRTMLRRFRGKPSPVLPIVISV